MNSADRKRAQRPSSRSNVRPTFSEEGGVRYLHFGTEWIQGGMRVARPNDLALEYTRQMMAWLLFLDPPERIVQLGLGAASLTKFCLASCPASQVCAVEINPLVIEAAHQMFRLPREHPRLELVCEDAALWTADPRQRGTAGILQVDLYDAEAAGPVCGSPAFYAACARVLADPGICVLNLFGRHASFPVHREWLSEAFGGRILVLPEIEEGNRIVLAFKGPPIERDWEAAFLTAQIVENRYRLPARRWVKGLRSVNFPTQDRLAV
jgi:spermidine synthase